MAAAYTMQRERDVHEAFIAVDTGDETIPASAADRPRGDVFEKPDIQNAARCSSDKAGMIPMDDDDATFGDNVELF